MHSDISQSSTCSSSWLTSSALFEVKLQFVKVPSPSREMKTAPPCKQVDRTTQPHTHTQTHTQQSVHACMHSFIHSFIQSTIFTLSLFHKNEPSITTAIHHNLQSSIHQSSTMHCTDHSVGQSYMHAWCCHDSHTMERNCMRIPLANHHLTQIHTYMHACMHV